MRTKSKVPVPKVTFMSRGTFYRQWKTACWPGSHWGQRRRLCITVACLEFRNNMLNIPGCFAKATVSDHQTSNQIWEGSSSKHFGSDPGSSEATLVQSPQLLHILWNDSRPWPDSANRNFGKESTCPQHSTRILSLWALEPSAERQLLNYSWLSE